jgi:O-antigen ligase
LAIQKWPDFYKPIGKTRGATHSGWIDFTLGLGIPGLLLVLVPLGASFWRALRKEGFWYSYIAWTAPTIILAYTVTEVSSDHFIELLFFMSAIFCGMTLKANDNALSEPGVPAH